MTEANRDILSAGMDAELSREELRFLLRRIDSDSALVEAWSRYHVARDGLRGELCPQVSAGFASRVMAAIDAEAATASVVTPVVAAQAPRRRWLHWSAGGAIAASVAVAALMLTQPAGPGSSVPMAQTPSAGNSLDLADASPAEPAAAPAVPQWLSGGTMASQFTQKAAFGGDSGGDAPYLSRSMPYQIHATRADAAGVDPNSGNVMFMVRPDGSRYVQPVAHPQVQAR
ncbi:sigma-E factor negative regulatory protein RseA [Luteibacter sp. Sphag1AF]|uniref:sigma-E factor negative regulatory protein n=1 Tax=Luteibacter sp. Sphag1AF TaxID=2587031 RepID=UPI001616BA38|nr:sigma-E factor negative regulatory protein [Luteibacter sp. Sphag1AF]MBB3228462.1 sigma-E factor negative regulatory protein RseA [Luteibacter sp. Sphag1AF]